jgi:aminopeptidase N
VSLHSAYDAATQTLDLSFTQTTAATPGQPHKGSLPIPVRLGLLDSDGAVQSFTSPEHGELTDEAVIVLDRAETHVRLAGVAKAPVISALRGFSAPVVLTTDAPAKDAFVLLAHDPDLFNRWEAAQGLARDLMLRRIAGEPDEVSEVRFADALGRTLCDPAADDAFKALALELPSEQDLVMSLRRADPGAIHEARETLRARIAVHLSDLLTELHGVLQEPGEFSADAAAAGRRALRNAALDMLVAAPHAAVAARAKGHFEAAANMTDAMGGLNALMQIGGEPFEDALKAFYGCWERDALVIDKWFAVQARSPFADVLGKVVGLTGHPAFDPKVPNRFRALVATFANANPFRFHDETGVGYRFLADQILRVDSYNPGLAARLVSPLGDFRRYREDLADLMRVELTRIAAAPTLSKNVRELVGKTLEQTSETE